MEYSFTIIFINPPIWNDTPEVFLSADNLLDDHFNSDILPTAIDILYFESPCLINTLNSS